MTTIESINNPTGLVAVTLHDGSTVSVGFYARVKTAMEAGLTAFDPGVTVTARKACGGPFWNTLDDGECLTAGSCVLSMVLANELPLTPLGRNSANSQIYRVN